MYERSNALVNVDRYATRLLVGFCFSAIVIVSGNFWLFSLLGVKAESQIVLYLFVGVLSTPIVFRGINRYLREPLFILALSYLLSAVLLGRSITEIGNNLVSVLVVAVVFCLAKTYRETIVRFTIVMCSVFAMLGLIQFVVLLFYPEMKNHITSVAFENSYLHNKSIEFYPLQFFGFVTGESYEIFGRSVTRASSFLKEPSLVVPYFLITGAFALSYSGAFRLLAIPLIMFTVITMSGAAGISFMLSLGLIPLFAILKRKQWLLLTLPFIALGMFVIVIHQFEVDELVTTSMAVLNPLKEHATFLEKETSIKVRLEYLKVKLTDIKSNYLGLPYPVSEVGGLFFYSLYYAGIVGGGIILVVMYEFFALLASLYVRKAYSLSVILMFGAYIQALLFTSGGFVGPAGFLIMALVLRRLRELRGGPRNLTSPTRESSGHRGGIIANSLEKDISRHPCNI